MKNKIVPIHLGWFSYYVVLATIAYFNFGFWAAVLVSLATVKDAES